MSDAVKVSRVAQIDDVDGVDSRRNEIRRFGNASLFNEDLFYNGFNLHTFTNSHS